MNILTIPLTAVGLFALVVTYQHIKITPAQKDAQAVPTINVNADDHEKRSPGKIDVVLQSDLSAGKVRISVVPDESLALVSPTHEWTFDAAQSTQMILPVELFASSNGVHHLNIFVREIRADTDQAAPGDEGINDEVSARALAIEFSVGQSAGMSLLEKHEISSSEAYPKMVRLNGKEEIY
jgi:hypothetical protein